MARSTASESSMPIELVTGTPNRLTVSCRWIIAITRDFRCCWRRSRRSLRAASSRSGPHICCSTASPITMTSSVRVRRNSVSHRDREAASIRISFQAQCPSESRTYAVAPPCPTRKTDSSRVKERKAVEVPFRDLCGNHVKSHDHSHHCDEGWRDGAEAKGRRDRGEWQSECRHNGARGCNGQRCRWWSAPQAAARSDDQHDERR